MTKFFNKQTLIVAISFLLTLLLAKFDPLNLDPVGDASTSLLKLIYVLPAIGLWVYFLWFPSHYGKKNVEELKWINRERIASLFRTAIQSLGAIVAVLSAYNVNIPWVQKLLEVFSYLAENLDVGVNAIATLVGIGITVYGFFFKKERFEERGSDSGTQIK